MASIAIEHAALWHAVRVEIVHPIAVARHIPLFDLVPHGFVLRVPTGEIAGVVFEILDFAGVEVL